MVVTRLMLIGLLLVGGCSLHPIVDPLSIGDPARFNQDVTECRAIANRQQELAGAALGGVVGGGLGAALGGITGNRAAEAGGIGAILGAVTGLAKGAQQRQSIERNCLRGRGYNILN